MGFGKATWIFFFVYCLYDMFACDLLQACLICCSPENILWPKMQMGICKQVYVPQEITSLTDATENTLTPAKQQKYFKQISQCTFKHVEMDFTQCRSLILYISCSSCIGSSNASLQVKYNLQHAGTTPLCYGPIFTTYCCSFSPLGPPTQHTSSQIYTEPLP